MSARPPAHLLKSFDDELTALIAEGLDRAYQIVSKTHDPKLGFNAVTFGLNLYYVVVFQVVEELKKREQTRIKVLSERPVFRLLVDDTWEVAVHRVGSSAADDIYESFPSTASSAVAAMVAQQSLPFVRAPITPRNFDNATKVVLAHLGNYVDGLCALYACIPTRFAPTGEPDAEEGRIIEWGVAHPLMRRKDSGDHADHVDLPPPAGPTESTPPSAAVELTDEGEPLAPDEQIDEIDLPLKKLAKTDDDRAE